MKYVHICSIFYILPLIFFACTTKETKTEYYYYEDGEESNIPYKTYTYYLNGDKEILHGDYIEFFQDSSIKVQCLYIDGSLNGEYIEYSAPDTITLKCNYQNGLLEGAYISYYENGSINEIHQYRDNMLNGPYKSFYETGEKYEESNFKNDLLEGERVLFFLNGEINKKEVYHLGNLHGISESYFKNGTLNKKIQYRNGEPWNIITINDVSGNKLSERSLIDGNGIFIEFSPIGKKILETPIRNGKPHGISIIYDTTGNIVMKIPYEHGQKNGQINTFYNNGKIAQKIEIHNDITIDYKHFNEEGVLVWEIPYKKPPFDFSDSLDLNLIDDDSEGIYKQLSTFTKSIDPIGMHNGIQDGCEKHYYDNGKIKSAKCYHEGVVDSLQIDYYPNGQIKMEKYIDRAYENMRRYEIHFDSLGNEIKKIKYKLR
ncbi:MAG: hypothetical protein ACK4ND_00280 [Cytophagaceae bacterium]